MTDYLDNVRKLVNDAITELENRAEALTTEQEDSENAHDEWDDEPKDSRGEEPDVLDHNEAITKLSRVQIFLEKAIDELED